MKLVHEPRVGSRERGKRERGAGIAVRNPKIEKKITKNRKFYKC
jgi:hypothetical protein